MTNPIVDSLWNLVRGGRHVAAIGFVPFPLTGTRGLSVVRVNCDEGATESVLDGARVAIDRLLGNESDEVPARAVASAGHALLADGEGAPQPLEALVASCNRLTEATEGRAALVIDAVDGADAATIKLLAQLLRDPALRLPLVLSWHEEPDGATAMLLDAIRLASGEEAIARAPESSVTFDWSSLLPDALAVARAAAIVGSRFHAATVAALLDVPEHRVLAYIQQAVDAGAPILDEGTGTFVLPRAALRALRERTLPSLAAHLHTRLAHLLGAPRASAAPNPAAAARHFAEAGESVAAIERFIDAAAKRAEEGDWVHALGHAKEADTLLAQLPKSARTQALLARVHLECGRAQWAGAGADPSLTLRDALASVDAAAAALPPGAAPTLRADVASVLAAIAYDMGEASVVARAMRELESAGRAMHAAGDAVRAARMWSDEAALHMRFGSCTRAAELLEQAQQLLMRARGGGETGRATNALALTEHLAARIPLHAKRIVAPSRETVLEAIKHAVSAQKLYEELGHRRGVARVLETMGRLELLASLPTDAERHVLEALTIEQETGDTTGLARTTAALAELLAARGNLEEAVSLIASSATLNVRRGAPAALAYNREALARVKASDEREANPELEARISQLDQSIARSEGTTPRSADAVPPATAPLKTEIDGDGVPSRSNVMR